MLYDFFEMCDRELKNFDSAKSFYKIAEKDFKNTGDVEYFTDFLSRLYKAQGKDNFKKITSFDFNLINKKENTINELLDLIGIFVKIKGKKNTAEASGLSVPTINNILSKNKNTTIYSLEKLFGIFKLNVSYSLL